MVLTWVLSVLTREGKWGLERVKAVKFVGRVEEWTPLSPGYNSLAFTS